MYSTFNMGIGMCVVVPASEAEKAIAHLKENGEEAFLIGTVGKRRRGCRFMLKIAVLYPVEEPISGFD